MAWRQTGGLCAVWGGGRLKGFVGVGLGKTGGEEREKGRDAGSYTER